MPGPTLRAATAAAAVLLAIAASPAQGAATAVRASASSVTTDPVGGVMPAARPGPAGDAAPRAAEPGAPIAAPVLVPLFAGSPTGAPAGGQASAGPGAEGSTVTPEAGSTAASGGSVDPPGTAAGPAGPTDPSPAPDPGLGDPLDPDAVAAAVRPLLTGGALGRGRTPAHVVDVATGEVLLYSAAREATTPASTMKLVTAVSVLEALGPDAVLRTRTVILNPNAKVARVVVVGAGDPSLRSTGTKVGGTGTSLTPASLAELADATARVLAARGIDRVRIGFDDSLFTGPAMHPTWAGSFPAAGIVAPVSALQVDQGRRTPKGIGRVDDPAQAAARTFAGLLDRPSLKVTGEPKRVVAREDSVALASVASPTIGVLVERTLATSDNDYAEALARLGAAASGEQASFAGVAARGAGLLDELGIPAPGARVADGSGLSRANALAPTTLTALLRVTSTGFGAVASGLPVAAATGSLRNRYDSPATSTGAGLVRAKTGTLTGVVGLAGYASRPDGRLLAFAVLDDSVPGGALGGRAAVDRAIVALLDCDCAAR